MPHLQHLVQVSHALLQIALHVAAVAPMVEPAHPEFRAHQGTVRVFPQRPEPLLGPGAEIPRRQRPRYPACVQALREGAVRRHQGHLHAVLCHQAPDCLQVPLVIGIVAVLVLHLHQDDRASFGALPGRQLRQQHPVIFLHMAQERGVAYPQLHALLPQKPRGQAAELPLRADVGRGTQNHIQPQLLSQPDEPLNVQDSFEPELSLLLLVHVPGDVGLHRVASQVLQLFQPVLPVFRNHPEIVDCP